MAPHCFSTISLASRFWSGVPSRYSTLAKSKPIAYMWIAGLAPSRNSSIAQRSELGAGTPPISAGTPICQKPEST